MGDRGRRQNASQQDLSYPMTTTAVPVEAGGGWDAAAAPAEGGGGGMIASRGGTFGATDVLAAEGMVCGPFSDICRSVRLRP
jgi:hypothetical protein